MAADDEQSQENTIEGADDGADDLPVEINHCPSCEGDIDIAGLGPFTKVVCPHCGESVRVRTRLGNYQIRNLLGEGGMSQVFLAEDLALDRQVALKILHMDLSRDAALMALFEREAKLTASINHPNVVKVYTVGSDGGYFFIAMELVDNVSLETRITEQGMMPEREALDLLHDIAAGLRTAYQGGLIHRDIKPGNILLTKSGTGKLVDFGLAVKQGGDDEVEDLWATPFYVPPEKLEGEQDDFRGDIYSLGATFFHAMCGRPPFAANTASLDDLRAIKAQPVTLSQANAPVSSAAVKLIDRMMAYSPEKRFDSYELLVKAIEDTQAKLPGSAASRAQRQKALVPKKKESSALVWMGIGGGMLAIAGAVVWILGNGKPSGEAGSNLVGGGGGGEVVLNAGQQNAAVRYIQARDMILAGNNVEAKRTLDDLIRSGELRNPTLGWARFNLGLIALFGGGVSGMTSGGAEEGADPVGAFVQKLGPMIESPLPVMPDAGKQLLPNSLESIGLLAFGLKNWNHGEFSSAIAFFDAFDSAVLPGDLAWMAGYRKLAAAYRADHQTLAELPKPTMAATETELESMRGQIKTIATKLKTKGGAVNLAQRRLKRIDDIVAEKKALAAAPPTPAPMPAPDPGTPAPPPIAGWTPEAEAERAKFIEALAVTKPSLEGYRFAEAASAAGGFVAATPAVRQLQADYLDALKQAAGFKDRLTAFLAPGTYNGKLIRKKGLPIDVKILSAAPDKLVVDLMFGPNDLAWGEVSPAWMHQIAREGWLFDEVTDTNAPDWIQAACFLRLTGERDAAEQLATATSRVSPEFGLRWERLKAIP
jgi:tRNA A-37 threonylcarbamoyl transferase component Bud32